MIAIALLPVFLGMMEVVQVLPFIATIYGQGFEICSKPLASITLVEVILVSILFHVARSAFLFVWTLYKLYCVGEEELE